LSTEKIGKFLGNARIASLNVSQVFENLLQRAYARDIIRVNEPF
jgi:hypothetical protein